MANSNGPTLIKALNSSDADGTIASYNVTSIPPPAQGVLSYCSNGTEPCTGTVTAVTATTNLTAAQMATLKFDPTAGFVGNATFSYNATDNSGNISNTANYTIPVAAVASNSVPPLADNVSSQSMNNSLANNPIPALSAHDLDGAVVNYTIATIPPASQGVLRISCPSTPTTPVALICVGGFADVLPGVVLTPAESARLFFDPAPSFVGTANFTFTAKDNSGLTSNIANYNLSVVNNPPVSTNLTTIVPFNATTPTAIPALSGSDGDGVISKYTVTTVPTAAQGILTFCNSGDEPCTGTVTAITAGTVLAPAQANTLKFTPATGFSGSAPFNYTSIDNNGNVSAPAVYNIKVAQQPPVTTDVVNAVLANTLGATTIGAFSGTDSDGTIASYTLLSVPDPSQGVLSIPCPATPAMSNLNGPSASVPLNVGIAEGPFKFDIAGVIIFFAIGGMLPVPDTGKV